MIHIINALTEIGLSEKEARVYLAAAELGPTAVQAIATKAGVNRATTYVMIESLTARGLMRSAVCGKKCRFCAEHPKKILDVIKEGKRRLLAQEAGLRHVFEDIIALSHATTLAPELVLETPSGEME